jgi:hypothetical protein
MASLASLRALGAGDASPQAGATRVLYEIYATAKARENADGPALDAALQRSNCGRQSAAGDPVVRGQLYRPRQG